MSDWIQTASGQRFDINNIGAYHPDLEDIATGLSNICRFGGQCPFFYSVAEHSVRLAEYAEDRRGDMDMARVLLLHDAAEALLGDVVRPHKRLVPNLIRAEAALMAAVWGRFGVAVNPDILREAEDLDGRILEDERLALFPASTGWPRRTRLGVMVAGWEPPLARMRFLEAARKLGVR